MGPARVFRFIELSNFRENYSPGTGRLVYKRLPALGFLWYNDCTFVQSEAASPLRPAARRFLSCACGMMDGAKEAGNYL